MTRALIAAFAAFTLAACGGASGPTAPSPADAGASLSPTAASIRGTIAGAGSAQLFSSTGAGAGMTVTVAGTSLSTTVNSLGQFIFENVPVGTAIALRFVGAGANAQLPVGTLGAGETLTITVTVNGSTAAIESQARGNGSEVEGRIESIQPGTIVVAARTVTVGAATTIRHGDTAMTFEDLLVGMRVHVKGTPSGTGATATTAATEIIVQNVNTGVPVNLEGAVSALTGTAGAFEFVLDGRTVKGDITTEFRGGSTPQFSQLADGRKVHVKGTQQNGYVQASTVILQGGGGLIPGSTFQGSGAAGGVKGSCPTIAFTLKGVKIASSSSTLFTGVTCAALKSGRKVAVSGIVQADQSVLANSIASN